jgi:hypothetical protein
MPSINSLIVVVGRYSACGFAQLKQNSKKSKAKKKGKRRMSSNRACVIIADYKMKGNWLSTSDSLGNRKGSLGPIQLGRLSRLSDFEELSHAFRFHHYARLFRDQKTEVVHASSCDSFSCVPASTRRVAAKTI